MGPLLLLIITFAAGIALRRLPNIPDSMPAALNAFIIYVALPALVLLHVPILEWDPALTGAVLMPWLLMALTLIAVTVVCRVMRWSKARWGALLLTAGLGNTSFVGLPMIEAFFGKEGLPLGLLIDQFGSFIMVSTIGLAAAAFAAGEDPSAKRIAYRIVSFPPFVALILAFAIRFIGPLPEPILDVLQRLGDTLAPLALLSVGMQLRLDGLKANKLPLAFGLSWKLIVGPFLILLFYRDLLGYEGSVLGITILEAGMASMITGSIIAAEYDLETELVSMMVGVGIPLSFITVAAWMWII